MRLEQQVCSLEFAQQLKAFGVSQNSTVSWVYHEPMGVDIRRGAESEFRLRYGKPSEYFDAVAAFTVAELGEMLPPYIKSEVEGYIDLDMRKFESPAFFQWSVQFINRDGKIFEQAAATEADARAKMLIYLLENKLIIIPKPSHPAADH
jgi:hypothetical protein